MLYHLFVPFIQDFGLLNVFRYITFRTGGAILTAIFLGLWLGPRIIRWLKSKQKDGQPIRIDGPESHLKTKQGTPTMGGVIILLTFLVSTFLWADLTNPYVWVLIFSTLGFSALGAFDDYKKLTRRSSAGISSRSKFLCQVIIGGITTYIVMRLSSPDLSTKIALPFLKDYFIDLGYFFIPWGILVLVGTSNAVNLTDGLDGLVTVPIILTAVCFCLITYLVGNQIFSNYLHINFVPGTGELATMCGALIGASLAFLWYNAPPAQIFMGDTGSLAVGGMIGALSVITKHELVLVIVGGLFVIETLSVIIQVISFKLTGKRIFLMAPLHHHFEQKGWAESTVVVRFWIISVIFALLGLATLKLR